ALVYAIHVYVEDGQLRADGLARDKRVVRVDAETSGGVTGTGQGLDSRAVEAQAAAVDAAAADHVELGAVVLQILGAAVAEVVSAGCDARAACNAVGAVGIYVAATERAADPHPARDCQRARGGGGGGGGGGDADVAGGCRDLEPLRDA